MTDSERVLEGWEEIANFFGWSRSKAIAKKDELKTFGAIFYTRKGNPPMLTVQAFPSVLRAWTIKKSLKNEIL